MKQLIIFQKNNGLLVIFILWVGFQTACSSEQSFSEDFVKLKNTNVFSITLPDLGSGYYGFVTWVDNTSIVISYSSSHEQPFINKRFFLYDWNKDWVEPIAFEAPACEVGKFLSDNKIPGHTFGFIYECRDLSVPGAERILYLWDKNKNRLEEFSHYPNISPEWLVATQFTTSPDRSQIIQEDHGDGVFNGLNLVVNSELSTPLVTPIVPEFFRAGHPAWSPNGDTIAFAGTKEIPDRLSNNAAIDELLDLPWSIYLIDLDNWIPRPIASDFKYAKNLRWAPNSNLLAFTSQFEGVNAIWIFDVSMNILYQFRQSNSKSLWVDYDWSPTGRQMIVFDYELVNDRYVATPIIVDVPDILLDH